MSNIGYLSNVFSFILSTIRSKKEKITPNSTLTSKCKYCSTIYTHGSVGPQVNVYYYNEYAFKPALKSILHNTREPFKCERCGADVDIKVERAGKIVKVTVEQK